MEANDLNNVFHGAAHLSMDDSPFEILREQVDLETVASRFTDLRRSGSTLKAHCPYPDHEDKTPSFHIYPDNRYYCFGCCRFGDVTDLWSALNECGSNIEAAKSLAREYGVDLPEMTQEDKEVIRKRRSLEAQYLSQAQEARQVLSRNPEVRDWWKKRNFDEELCDRFLLGSSENGTEAITPFWYRGRVHGLIRRKLYGEPKYVLPKAEDLPAGHRPLFVPGRTSGEVYLVEGYVDALAASALGMDAIAVGGTGISEQQLAELRRIPGPIYIVADRDEEGEKAARQWVQDLYPDAFLCPPLFEESLDDKENTDN